MPAETLRIDGGRGDDELEIATSGQEALQVAQEEIDVQTNLPVKKYCILLKSMLSLFASKNFIKY